MYRSFVFDNILQYKLGFREKKRKKKRQRKQLTRTKTRRRRKMRKRKRRKRRKERSGGMMLTITCQGKLKKVVYLMAAQCGQSTPFPWPLYTWLNPKRPATRRFYATVRITTRKSMTMSKLLYSFIAISFIHCQKYAYLELHLRKF